MLPRFEQLAEAVITALTRNNRPVSYTMPDELSNQEQRELLDFIENNIELFGKIDQFFRTHATPHANKQTQEQLSLLWDQIFKAAQEQQALPNILQYEAPVNDQEQPKLTQDSLQKIEAVKKYVVERFTERRQLSALQKDETNKTYIQTFDDNLKAVQPEQRVTFDKWLDKRTKF